MNCALQKHSYQLHHFVNCTGKGKELVFLFGLISERRMTFGWNDQGHLLGSLNHGPSFSFCTLHTTSSDRSDVFLRRSWNTAPSRASPEAAAVNTQLDVRHLEWFAMLTWVTQHSFCLLTGWSNLHEETSSFELHFLVQVTVFTLIKTWQQHANP